MIFETAEVAFEFYMAGLLCGGLAAAYIVTIAMIVREGIRR